ncbi:related to DNA polymerase delta subunit 4 [Cephalotrichum gorgonifer]|uniref:Related to DNA polymerase delta subunit 4 n=1 Tax=Cephalotrichum gorgonifer TaxID=2041049 RepID=A0AAE8MYX0_9PEZI|nr:related to DNA polymerase delta subunit 4 [Cephalotrichum gorgonifer]
MPTTRRSTGGSRARAGPAKGQSTISFASRVTKSVPRDAKKAVLSEAPKTATVKATPIPDNEAEEAPVIVKEVVIEEEAKTYEKATPDAEKSEAELRAEGVSDEEIEAYWNELGSQRMGPRLHQEDLTLSEKVLRYFDVSSQYGPSIGIDRTKRWMRAERVGLNPPIEVLAVLLKEDVKKNKSIETAYTEVLLNHTAGDS